MNGVLTITDDPRCNDCGRTMYDHSRTRVNHGNGRYSYDYECPT